LVLVQPGFRGPSKKLSREKAICFRKWTADDISRSASKVQRVEMVWAWFEAD
jgi:hypothetical protein